MRLPALAAAATVLALALAGCGTPAAGPSFMLSGAFTADRTQQDLDEFQAIVRPYSDEAPTIMESFPEQFVIHGIEGGCEQLRVTLDSKDYIASVGTCTEERPSDGNGDEVTSSS